MPPKTVSFPVPAKEAAPRPTLPSDMIAKKPSPSGPTVKVSPVPKKG